LPEETTNCIGTVSKLCVRAVTFGFRSIARFRRRHLDALADLLVQSLHLAQKLGTVEMGRFALDGTKLEASASRHRAMTVPGTLLRPGRLGDLLPDPHRRVQRRHRVLEHRAEVVAPDPSPYRCRRPQHVLAVHGDLACGHGVGRQPPRLSDQARRDPWRLTTAEP
jgi:hypothetical protein